MLVCMRTQSVLDSFDFVGCVPHDGFPFMSLGRSGQAQGHDHGPGTALQNSQWDFAFLLLLVADSRFSSHDLKERLCACTLALCETVSLS